LTSPFPKNTGGKSEKDYDPGNKSLASASKITTTDEDQKKLNKLYNIVDSRIEEQIVDLKTTLLEHGQKIDGVIKEFNSLCEVLKGNLQPQQGTTTQPPQPATGPQINFQELPSDVKADALAKIGTAAAQMIQAWKGGGETHSDFMGQLGKEMLTDLVRATVDDIQQRVYNIKKLPPANISQTNTSHRIA